MDRDLCVRYGRNARAYAEKTFDIGRITDSFLSIFAPDPKDNTELKNNLKVLVETSGTNSTGTLYSGK
jgi:hypothetical protein